MSWRDALERRDMVKAAFMEGFDYCGSKETTDDADRAWLESRACRRLAQPEGYVPPIPPMASGPRDKLEHSHIANHLGSALSPEPQSEEREQ